MDAFEGIGVTDERRILQVLSDYLQLPVLEREDYPEKPVLLEGVSMFFLRKHAILPIQIESGRVRVVVNNPLNLSLVNLLGNYFVGMEISLYLGLREEIRTAIDRFMERRHVRRKLCHAMGRAASSARIHSKKTWSTSGAWRKKHPSCGW